MNFQEKSFLLLSAVNDHLKADRAALLGLGSSACTAFKKGHQAFEYLKCHKVDMILCDSEISDMDASRFFHLLGSLPALRAIPVIMVTRENRKDEVLRIFSLGCSGYVLRPYETGTFRRHLWRAFELTRFKEVEALRLQEGQSLLESANFDDAIEAFEEVLSVLEEAKLYHEQGLAYLANAKYGLAIISFKQAVRLNELFAEAYHGLSKAYKAKGEDDKALDCLRKAADLHAQFGRLEETKTLFLEILSQDSKSPNPFNTLGIKLRKAGDYAGAIDSYRQALLLTPQDEHVYYNLAKALYFRGQKPDSLANLEKALEINGDFFEARRLYEEIAQKKPMLAAAFKRPENPSLALLDGQ